MTADLLTVTNRAGTPFNVRLVRVGDRYGREDCLVHGETKFDNGPDSLPLVEFYAANNTDKFGPRGQFVARYRYDTLAKCATENTGINLCGHVSGWFVDADNIREALAWTALRLARAA